MDNIFTSAPLWIIALCAFAIVIVAMAFVVHYKGVAKRNTHLPTTKIGDNNKVVIELTSIKWLLFLIFAFLVLAYCFWMSVHYHIQHYMNVEITSKHADYLGMIAGFFSILVTLLVGWQIYATIRTRQELTETRDEIEKRLNARLDEFEDCCRERGEQIDDINNSKKDFEHRIKTEVKTRDKAHEARLYFAQATTLSLLADLEKSIKKDCFEKLNKNTKEVKFQYSMAYRYYFEALLFYAQSGEMSTEVEACLSNMERNLKSLEHNDEDSKEKFEINNYNRCDKLYNKIIKLILNNQIDTKLAEWIKDLHKRRKKIRPYDLSEETNIKVVSVDADSEAAQHLFRIVREARAKRIAEEKARKEQERKDKEADAKPTEGETEG